MAPSASSQSPAPGRRGAGLGAFPGLGYPRWGLDRGLVPVARIARARVARQVGELDHQPRV